MTSLESGPARYRSGQAHVRRRRWPSPIGPLGKAWPVRSWGEKGYKREVVVVVRVRTLTTHTVPQLPSHTSFSIVGDLTNVIGVRFVPPSYSSGYPIGAEPYHPFAFFLIAALRPPLLSLNGLVRPSSPKTRVHDLCCLGRKGVSAARLCNCHTNFLDSGAYWLDFTWRSTTLEAQRGKGLARWVVWWILALGFLEVIPLDRSTSSLSSESVVVEGAMTRQRSLLILLLIVPPLPPHDPMMQIWPLVQLPQPWMALTSSWRGVIV
jgi:hypothetical protein